MTEIPSRPSVEQNGQALQWPRVEARIRRLALFLLLVMIANALAGCWVNPTPPAVSNVSPTAASPTPSPTRTLTALPTVPAVTPRTATSVPSITPSRTPALTYTPSLTPSPSATPTWTNTPAPPRPTITPTKTITPTPSPTLTPTPMFSPTPMPTPTYSGNFVSILLLGLDSTRNLGAQNTDVILAAVIDKDAKQVSLLSIPRDLWVYIPTYGWSRINVAHKIGHRTGYPGGGPGLLMETIKVNFGLSFDYWVRIDFWGFTRVVNALGGVDMTVACPVNLRYLPPESEEEEEMILEPGVYHFDGATALRYVRTRRGGNDFDRAQRQHQFLKAMWDQAKSPDLILKIPGLWSALKDSFQTDLDLGAILSLAPLALDLGPERVRSRYIGGNQTESWINADGWQVLLPDYDEIRKVVASLYAPPSAGTDQVAAEGARIQVRNGTYRYQLAKIAADRLHWYGLDIVDTALADNPNYQQTRIIVFNDKPNTLALLVRLLDVAPENIVHQPDPNQPADMQVILGNDYDPCR
jgi:LCP family protein required for cell wall assembly